MRIVAKALIFDKQGSVLVLYRSDTHPHFAHHPDFPGGEVKQNEDPIEAVVREVKEETSLIIESSKLKLAFEKRLPGNLRHMLFAVDLASMQPDIITSWEHDDYKWLAVNILLNESLPDNTDSYYIDAIEWLGSRPTS